MKGLQCFQFWFGACFWSAEYCFLLVNFQTLVWSQLTRKSEQFQLVIS